MNKHMAILVKLSVVFIVLVLLMQSSSSSRWTDAFLVPWGEDSTCVFVCGTKLDTCLDAADLDFARIAGPIIAGYLEVVDECLTKSLGYHDPVQRGDYFLHCTEEYVAEHEPTLQSAHGTWLQAVEDCRSCYDDCLLGCSGGQINGGTGLPYER